MEKPYSIEKIKAMKYPTRQDMREAIWFLIELIESSGSKPPICNCDNHGNPNSTAGCPVHGVKY